MGCRAAWRAPEVERAARQQAVDHLPGIAAVAASRTRYAAASIGIGAGACGHFHADDAAVRKPTLRKNLHQRAAAGLGEGLAAVGRFLYTR